MDHYHRGCVDKLGCSPSSRLSGFSLSYLTCHQTFANPKMLQLPTHIPQLQCQVSMRCPAQLLYWLRVMRHAVIDTQTFCTFPPGGQSSHFVQHCNKNFAHYSPATITPPTFRWQVIGPIAQERKKPQWTDPWQHSGTFHMRRLKDSISKAKWRSQGHHPPTLSSQRDSMCSGPHRPSLLCFKRFWFKLKSRGVVDCNRWWFFMCSQLFSARTLCRRRHLRDTMTASKLLFSLFDLWAFVQVGFLC